MSGTCAATEENCGLGRKVVLAYSGGLDTSVIVRWLAEKGWKVICVAVDLGQQESLDMKKKALASGAVKYVVKDIRDEFVRDGVFMCLRADAKYEGRYLLGTSHARPFIIKAIAEVVRREKAEALAHGATGKGNDQCRFELAAYALLPGIKMIAPWRDAEFRALIPGRREAIEYAAKFGIPIKATAKKPWSTDPNLAHRSHEAGELEDPWFTPRDEMYELTTPAIKAPAKPECVEISFRQGYPIALNGKKLSSVALLEKLNQLAGKHGVGVTDMVENRFVGMKSRGVYEAPGMTVLYLAHRDLEGLTMDRETMLLRDTLAPKFAQLVYDGYWFSPALDSLRAFVNESQKCVSGLVKVELYKSGLRVVGRKSAYSLYDPGLATMEAGGGYNQDDATGFLRIVGLPTRVMAARKRKVGLQ
jgi:argininosuccinate synthase